MRMRIPSKFSSKMGANAGPIIEFLIAEGLSAGIGANIKGHGIDDDLLEGFWEVGGEGHGVIGDLVGKTQDADLLDDIRSFLSDGSAGIQHAVLTAVEFALFVQAAVGNKLIGDIGGHINGPGAFGQQEER